MIYSSIFIVFYASFASCQTTETTSTPSEIASSEATSSTSNAYGVSSSTSSAYSSTSNAYVVSSTTESGSGAYFLSAYSSQISQVLESISACKSLAKETAAYKLPSGDYESSYGQRKGVNVTCSISCHKDGSPTPTASIESNTPGLSKRSLEAPTPESAPENISQGSDTRPRIDDLNRPILPIDRVPDRPLNGPLDRPLNRPLDGPLDGPLDRPLDRPLDCESRNRPNSPQIPWGWPSNYRANRPNRFLCHYHAATGPECEVIYQQAAATYCSKSRNPRLCVVKACQVMDQCKNIVATGRGYCWNPKWFSG